MKVAIVNLTGGGISGGYRKYLGKLLPLLRDHSAVRSLDVYSPPQTREMLRDAAGEQHFWSVGDARRGYAGLRTMVRRSSADVVFIPTARHLNFGDLPVAVMVRNMEPLVTPFATSSVLESAQNLARRYVARRACDSAQRVFAVSEFVRDFLTARWSVPASKIGVVYHGVSAPADADALAAPPSLTAIGSAPFVFTAGSIRPSRGLEDVILAFSRLGQHRASHRLVIAGEVSGSSSYLESMRRLAVKSGVDREVVWAGQLSPQQMAWCYLHCAAFVMSSRIEACPNTALEALAHGAVTISTRNPPMPEFFGDTSLYYPAGDSVALAAALTDALSFSADRRAAIASSARRRVSTFTWQRTAELTIAELRVCMAGQPLIAAAQSRRHAEPDSRLPSANP